VPENDVQILVFVSRRLKWSKEAAGFVPDLSRQATNALDADPGYIALRAALTSIHDCEQGIGG